MKYLKVKFDAATWDWSLNQWEAAEIDSFIHWLRNNSIGRLELSLSIIKMANSVEAGTYTQEQGEDLYLHIVNKGIRRYIKSQGLYKFNPNGAPKLMTVSQLFDAKTRKGIALLLLQRYQLEVNSLINYRKEACKNG